MGVPLYVISCFSLAAFKIPYLSLFFAILIRMCLDMDLFGFILFGFFFLVLLTWMSFPFPA